MARKGRDGQRNWAGTSIEWTRALIRRRQRARMRQQRQPVPRVPASELARIRELLERGATEREMVDAAAALAQPPASRQGRLL